MNQIQFLCPLATERSIVMWGVSSEVGVSLTGNLGAGALAVAAPLLGLVRKAQVRREQVDAPWHPVTCQACLFIE